MFKSLFFALFWHLWLCLRASYFISDHLLLTNLLRILLGRQELGIGIFSISYTVARLCVFTVKHTKVTWATWLEVCCCTLAKPQASHLRKKHKLRQGSLCRRFNLNVVSNICKAAPISLFWVLNGLNELWEMCSEFPFNLIGNLTMAVLTGQSFCILKSQYTGEGPEQGFQCCFANGLNQKLISVCGAG